MVHISEVNIISVDKSEESWEIEGEILFGDDLTSAFSVTYITQDDELDNLEVELTQVKYDKHVLKEMIVKAANDYDE